MASHCWVIYIYMSCTKCQVSWSVSADWFPHQITTSVMSSTTKPARLHATDVKATYLTSRLEFLTYFCPEDTLTVFFPPWSEPIKPLTDSQQQRKAGQETCWLLRWTANQQLLFFFSYRHGRRTHQLRTTQCSAAFIFKDSSFLNALYGIKWSLLFRICR